MDKFICLRLFSSTWVRFSAEVTSGSDWTGLNNVENRKLTLLGLELRPFRRPARSQLLYRLCCPGSDVMVQTANIKIRYKQLKNYSHVAMFYEGNK
jgi:hypothetical protein